MRLSVVPRWLLVYACVVSSADAEDGELALWDTASVPLLPDSLAPGILGKSSVGTTGVHDGGDTSGSVDIGGSKTVRIDMGGGTQVDQELRLDLDGRTADGILVRGHLSDRGRDPTTGGASAALSELDNVWIEFDAQHWHLLMGDQEYSARTSPLYAPEEELRGVLLELRGASSRWAGILGDQRGELRSVVFAGRDGQKSGYLLPLSGGIVFPGSVRVWWNGELLSSESDYTVDASLGTLDFVGSRIPNSRDEIRVEFRESLDGAGLRFSGAEASYVARDSALGLGAAGFRWRTDSARAELAGAWTLLPMPLGAGLRLDLAASRGGDSASHPASSWQLDSHRDGWSPWGNGQWFSRDYSSGRQRTEPWAFSDRWGIVAPQDSVPFQNHEAGVQWRRNGWTWRGSGGWAQTGGDTSGESHLGAFSVQHRSPVAEGSAELLANRITRAADTVGRVRFYAQSRRFSGWWRPYGDSRMSMAHLADSARVDVRAHSGVDFGPVDGSWKVGSELGGDLVRNEALQVWSDSLRAAEYTQSATLRKWGWTMDALGQARRSLTPSGRSWSWLTEDGLQGGRSSGAWEVNAGWEAGGSMDQPVVRTYQRVADGTGDVLYDSASGLWVEGVDGGDWVFEALRPDSTVDARPAVNTSLHVDLGTRPGLLFGVRRGLLRDLRLRVGWRGEGVDSGSLVPGAPPWSDGDLAELSSGLVRWSGGVALVPPDNSWSLDWNGERTIEKTAGSLAATLVNDEEELNASWRVKPWLVLRPSASWQGESRRDALRWSWRARGGGLVLDLGNLWILSPGTSRRSLGGDNLDGSRIDATVTGLELGLRRGFRERGRFSTRARLDYVDGNNLAFAPYSVLQGLGDGWNRRWETDVEYQMDERLQVYGNWLVRDRDGQKLFQRVSLEARAFL